MKSLIFLDSFKRRFPSSFESLYHKFCDVSLNRNFSKSFSLLKSSTVIAFDFDSEKKLKNTHIPFKSLKGFLPDSLDADAEEQAMHLVRSLKSNETFDKATTYADISLWWSVEIEAYGAIFLPIIKAILQVECVLDKGLPDKIILVNNNQLNHIIKLVAESRKIPVIMKSGSLSNLQQSATKSLMPLAFSFIEKSVIKNLRKVRKAKAVPFSDSKNNIVLMYIATRSIHYSLSVTDHLDKVKNQITVCEVNNNPNPVYKEKDILYKTFDLYIDGDINKKIDFAQKQFVKDWRELSNSKYLDIIFHNINLWPLVSDFFHFLFKKRFQELLVYIECTKKIIELEKPKIFIFGDERNIFGKPVLAAAKGKVHTLIIQHGLIVDSPFFNQTIADFMAIFGPFTKEVLTKRGVNPKKLFITGQPRFDKLANLNYDKQQTFNKLKISMDKKIVLLTPTTQVLEENELQFREVIKALKQLPDCHLVVKLHPSDNTILHETLSKELHYPCTILKDFDIYELIFSSSLVITSYSTTGLEAMILNKPVVTTEFTNILHRKGVIPYAESGAAMGIFSKDDVLPVLKKVLYNLETQKKLSDNRKSFVFDHAFKIDGKASERVANLIQQIVDSSSKVDNHLPSDNQFDN